MKPYGPESDGTSWALLGQERQEGQIEDSMRMQEAAEIVGWPDLWRKVSSSSIFSYLLRLTISAIPTCFSPRTARVYIVFATPDPSYKELLDGSLPTHS